MSTKQELRNRIADDIDRTDMADDIDVAVQRAIQFYEKELFWFQETSTAFVTASGQQTYSSGAVPSDLKEVLSVRATVSNYDQDIDRRDWSWMEQYDQSDVQGPPTDFAEWAGGFVFYPVPDGSYTVTVSYRKKYEEMQTDGASNDWTTEAEDLIESRATWWICNRKLKDYEGAQMSKQEELEALTSLRSKHENKVSTKKLRHTEF